MPESLRSSAIAKLLGETRWQILGELCRSAQTASELATRVKTSANAVRVHLDAMEKADLVTYVVQRRQVGKPTHVYSLTASGEALLSKAYLPALEAVLSAARKQTAGSRATLLTNAGIALAANLADASAEPWGVAAAARMFDQLGAVTSFEQNGGRTILEAACCPLGGLTRESGDACVLLESALRSASGMTTRLECIRGDHPRCRFEFTT
jgi:predicted ArsR family transcriptional regulator